MTFSCCSEERRKLVKQHPRLNGIDFLELIDNPSDPPQLRQRVLIVRFIKKLTIGELDASNFVITGGERIKNIKVTKAQHGSLASLPSSLPARELKIMRIRVSEAGDFSDYTLSLVKGAGDNTPPEDFDPIFSSINFSFKVLCSNNFDCKSENICPPESAEHPNINYLAKDYNSFRNLMLDRLSLLLPDWRENNPADIGVTLVELLAYAADQISYQQDAIATEAYLDTARKRISAKRHARLVDYNMHDGSNARCWIQVAVNPSIDSLELKTGKLSAKTKFVTGVPDKSTVIEYKSEEFEELLFEDIQVFELMHDSKLYSQHNSINFYTWGDKNCCLPKGASSASLLGNLTNLKPGYVLVFMEVKGPEIGAKEDANPSKRHAVRLTSVEHTTDPLGDSLLDLPPESLPGDGSVPVTMISWHIEDALPFPLCISAGEGSSYYDNISIALGNIVLADHGISLEDAGNKLLLNPATVPESNPILNYRSTSGFRHCDAEVEERTPPRFRPVLAFGPLTQAAAYQNRQPNPSAKSVMERTVKDINPEILLEQDNGTSWTPKRDLIYCDRNSRNFLVEIESDGTAFLRFGDNVHGSRPVPGSSFSAYYRIGNGEIGNIGANKIGHIVSNDSVIYSNASNIEKVWNPMAASGGFEPETINEVRQKVGQAFKTQERAVTADDYAMVSKKADNSIQRAAADFRWTGSWYTSFVTFDRYNGEEMNDTFADKMTDALNTYRMAGQDLKVSVPQFIPLGIEMSVCIEKDYDPSDVRKAILIEFTNQLKPNGLPGLFHPDNFTFGDTVYLSTFYAVAQAIPGVQSVYISKFQRPGIESEDAIEEGKIVFSHLEIPRLDNDPDYKENGVFNLIIKEGIQT